jgi:hypothetical protein
LQRLQAVNSPFGTLALFRPVKAEIISGFTGSRASWPFAPFLKCKRRPDEFSVVNQWVTVKTARAERVKSVLVAERGSGFLKLPRRNKAPSIYFWLYCRCPPS